MQSGATYLNRSLTYDAQVPEDTDAHNPPEWQHVSDEPRYQWHDHRAHWMGLVDPDAVKADPDHRRVVMNNTAIPILVGGEDGPREEIVVDVAYVPPPPAWPWVLAIVVGVAAIVAAGWRFGARRVGTVTGALLVVVTAFELVAAATASPVSPPVWWVAAVVAAVAALVVGLVRLTRREDALGAALLGASGIALAGLLGFVDRNWLARSQLPTDLAPFVARSLVVASLALGIGLAGLALVAVLRQPARAPEREAVAVT
jgi:hypothetical protein